MRIVKILGGIGNQMFQYAFHLALRNHFKDETVKIDVLAFQNYKLHNGFQLTRAFNISPEFASKQEQKRFSRVVNNYKLSRIFRRLLRPKKTEYIEKKDYLYDSKVFQSDKIYFEGYWQHISYLNGIENIVKEHFRFNIPENDDNITKIVHIFKTFETVSLHVRRGDYLKASSTRMICDLDYYKKAIEQIRSKKKNLCFLLFSDDIQWVSENITPLLQTDKYIIVNWNLGENSYKDMYLMSCCNNNIIANSSFSWWGAWLNFDSEKIVIAPSKWTNKVYTKDFSPESWLKIEIEEK